MVWCHSIAIYAVLALRRVQVGGRETDSPAGCRGHERAVPQAVEQLGLVSCILCEPRRGLVAICSVGLRGTAGLTGLSILRVAWGWSAV